MNPLLLGIIFFVVVVTGMSIFVILLEKFAHKAVTTPKPWHPMRWRWCLLIGAPFVFIAFIAFVPSMTAVISHGIHNYYIYGNSTLPEDNKVYSGVQFLSDQGTAAFAIFMAPIIVRLSSIANHKYGSKNDWRLIGASGRTFMAWNFMQNPSLVIAVFVIIGLMFIPHILLIPVYKDVPSQAVFESQPIPQNAKYFDLETLVN